MRATYPCLQRSYKSYEYAQIMSHSPPSEQFSRVRRMYQSTLRNRLKNIYLKSWPAAARGHKISVFPHAKEFH